VALTRQLLAFSRKQVLQPQVLDLGETLVGMQRMLRRLLGEDVQLSVCASECLGRVYADPGQIEQVIMNLAVNARDAMPEGGSLSIELSNVELDCRSAARLGVARGAWTRMSVADTGCGMDEATLGRIFEPFFTTKEEGRGTGLGLSTVYGIVEQSGGRITVRSAPGEGTSFDVYLPRREPAGLAAHSSQQSPARLDGTETVLLVEDDEQVRRAVEAALRRRGYRVIEAQNAGEALLIAERYAEPIDLLLTDVVLPRVSGRELAERLAGERAGMRVLYMSGYTPDGVLRHGVLDQKVAFVQKPVTPDLLCRRVRDLLDGPPAPAAG